MRRADIVREAIDAFGEAGLDGMAQYWDRQIDWRAIEGAVDDVGEIHGIEALRRYYQEWLDIFDDLTLVATDVREAADGRVVAEQHSEGRAKISGAETELTYAVVYTLRDGKIAHGREYATLEEALEVVNLQP